MRAPVPRVADGIRKARDDAGLSCVQVSKRTKEIGCAIHRVALGRMEAGEREVTISELITLAAALDVPPLKLLYPELVDEDVEAWSGLPVRYAEGYINGLGAARAAIDRLAF